MQCITYREKNPANTCNNIHMNYGASWFVFQKHVNTHIDVDKCLRFTPKFMITSTPQLKTHSFALELLSTCVLSVWQKCKTYTFLRKNVICHCADKLLITKCYENFMNMKKIQPKISYRMKYFRCIETEESIL